jgi:type I restriction enzyme S subunit
MEENSSSTTVAIINKSRFSDAPFALPPLAEQRRIVGVLEGLLGKVAASRERLARVPQLLKRFRQSVLAAACTGKLTADWRENRNSELSVLIEGEFPNRWRVVTLDEIAAKVQDGNYGAMYPKADEWTTVGVGFVTPAAIGVDGRIDLSKLKFVTPEKNAGLRKAQLIEGDVIFPNRGSRDAQRYGREPFAITIPTELLPANINPQLTLVRPRTDEVITDYLRLALNCEFFLSQVRAVTGGSALAFINLTVTRQLQFPLPPLAEQHEIVRRVEQLFALADRLEAQLDAARKRVDRLTQSILAKAFRGELVPTEADLARREARSYEPASELLTRIRQQQTAAAGPAAKTRKPRKSASGQ